MVTALCRLFLQVIHSAQLLWIAVDIRCGSQKMGIRHQQLETNQWQRQRLQIPTIPTSLTRMRQTPMQHRLVKVQVLQSVVLLAMDVGKIVHSLRQHRPYDHLQPLLQRYILRHPPLLRAPITTRTVTLGKMSISHISSQHHLPLLPCLHTLLLKPVVVTLQHINLQQQTTSSRTTPRL